MSTLYDKPKPEYKRMPEEQEDAYPPLIKSVKMSLPENYLWSPLTVGPASDLISFTDVSYGSMSSYDWSYGEIFLCED